MRLHCRIALDRNGARIPSERLELSQVEESLDVWIAMDGSQDKHVEMTKNKAQVFAAQISTKKVSRNDALYAHNSSFMKTLEYHMAATRLTEEQWNDTVRPAL